ncbi:dTMP kinase [uncultured Phascolarctobacterium sp.]|uniref:dTMP kinase n=1 Tax=uncultured Phascolarctobacterium sp. TaxID=512296 RepID=UPI0025F81900|nr:dTMP kinase [uncultured Phascolarctobacterium sp.]
MKGLFITFEGIDGGGKTTQLALAAKWLREQGYEVVESREPGGTPLAERVRELVLEPSLPLTTTTQTLLYLAARSEHVDKLLRPSVEAGRIVLCDRFSDSTLVYQGLSQGKSIEELALLRNLCSFASAGMAPDLTLVFDGRPEVLVRRRAARGVSDRYELQGLDFQQALRKGFSALAEAEPERLQLIDAEGSQEQVAASVRQAISALLHGEK